MVGVLLSLLSTYEGSSSRTVVTIGDVESRHLGKLLGDGVDVVLIADHPELMAETVDRSDEVILRLRLSVAVAEVDEGLVVAISEEHRLDVGVVDANMLHAVLLLVTAGELMLLDHAIHVVLHIGAHDETILRVAVHRLSVDVVVILLVLDEPSLLLEHLEVLLGALIDARVVLRGALGEVDLRLDDVVETHLVVTSLGASLV